MIVGMIEVDSGCFSGLGGAEGAMIIVGSEETEVEEGSISDVGVGRGGF